MKLVSQTLNEYQRGQDPKRSLRIGQKHIIQDITSNDLEDLEPLYDGKGGIGSFEDFKKYVDEASYGYDYSNDDELMKDYDRLDKIAVALGDSLEYGEFFDHHEFDQMGPYIDKYKPKGKDYIYNAYPGGDGIQLVFSDIFLPAAEEVDVDDIDDEGGINFGEFDI